MANAGKLIVEHIPKAFRFIVKSNGAQAVLDYRVLPNNIIEIFHTEVPPEYRGRGIAKQLCDSAFKYAADNYLKVYPSCSYAEKYAKETSNQAFKNLVVQNPKIVGS